MADHNPLLRAINSAALEPPYPADTRAAGWRFDLDTTRIRQSDTWTLARPEIRPWLLMLWVVAWEECPCGSLPADETLIAAKLGIDAALFSAHRGTIMRGWIRHSDGRLYHNVITEHVQQMIDKRGGNRNRQAKHRASRVTNALVTTEQVRTSQNKAVKQAPGPVDNSSPGPWWKTLDTIIAEGRRFGILATPGESRESLYQRVKEARKAPKRE